MGHQIIKQPNGLLCVWSTIVDDFIIVDATPEELVGYYAKKAAEDAAKSTARLVNAVIEGRAAEVYPRTVMTYAEALRSMQEALHIESEEAGG